MMKRKSRLSGDSCGNVQIWKYAACSTRRILPNLEATPAIPREPKPLRLLYWIFVVSMIYGLISCRSITETDSRKPVALIVFAAASLTDSFVELEQAFEELHLGVDLVLNFASSSQLVAQLREGITADIFASANVNQMQEAVTSGRVEPDEVSFFVANKLTIVVPAGNPADIRSLEDLGNTDVTFLMAVEGVPVRDYADQIIQTLPRSLQLKIYENLVSEESTVRQVSTKVALGEADAGIVYTSDITPDIAERVEQVEIPDTLNVTATYPIAVIADSAASELAHSFVDFVLSEPGQEILTKWGFMPIQTDVAY